MFRNWTFGRKVGFGFAVVVGLAVVIVVVSTVALQRVLASESRLLGVDARLLVDAAKLEAASERKVAAGRGFLLVQDERFGALRQTARDEFQAALGRLKERAYTAEGRRLLESVERADGEYERALEPLLALRRSAAPEAVARSFNERVAPRRDEVSRDLEAFVGLEERQLDSARKEASASAAAAILLVLGIAALAVGLAVAIAVVLTRTLARQVGTAVGQVQSSSAELQAAANQQAIGAREQATAMSEIATTISELLATSRQIAESAQRVAAIAEQTASASTSGMGTVAKAHESIAAIRRQVDTVVAHMLELGRKSQQIGSVLDIVSELAEQTHILAINATIEAAGAGEGGRRFSAVADEIRKLADRVSGSAKEIRLLIDEVRGAVNTTVMATESGSKSVDAGSRQFAEVAAAFQQISALVSTTSEAAREIELSTKQQSSAVEQLNLAIASVAQATQETEASSAQTLQTASLLEGLSRGLLRLVQPQSGA